MTAAPAHVTSRRVFKALLPLLVSGAILGLLLFAMGTGPFLVALRALSPLAVCAALVAGALATVIQAERWRLVSRGFGMELGAAESIAQCWQASFLNSVLPGGLAGDVLRTVEQRRNRGGSWRGSVGSVVGERITATVVTLAAAAAVLLPREPWLGAGIGAITLVVAGFAWISIRRIPWSSRAQVVVLSCANWVVFAGLFAVAVWVADSGVSMPVGDIVGLAALTLAGMSVPLSVGGWGPREGAAALGFVLLGYSAEQGVAVSVSYGILALVSVLPGAVVLLIRVSASGRKGQRAVDGEIPTLG